MLILIPFYIAVALFMCLLLYLSDWLKRASEKRPLLNFLIILDFIFMSCLLVGSVIFQSKILQENEVNIANEWLEVLILLAPMFWLIFITGMWRKFLSALFYPK